MAIVAAEPPKRGTAILSQDSLLWVSLAQLNQGLVINKILLFLKQIVYCLLFFRKSINDCPVMAFIMAIFITYS